MQEGNSFASENPATPGIIGPPTRGDPDPASFQAPGGYQERDVADMLKDIGELGKSKTQ
jgi:hypothetical protein